ncbi:MAG TPA: hypothetical protein VK571_05380 [Gemmatimonadaceae bacterium]|nr:hypothetical protein [Gemmatimonadaceae bacterium]
MTGKRIAEVRAQTLNYLGCLLRSHPDGDTGLWDDLDDEEAELAKKITIREGQKLIDRSRK